ncbi:MAG: hypothetical protein OEM52_11430 [bacterium]|nr:hypothetical protein [bacterium]
MILSHKILDVTGVIAFVALLLSLSGSTLAQPLTGNKTIGGTAPDYATFTTAVSDLASRGVGMGGVTFLVRPGTYNEVVTLSSINGSFDTPIAFQRESGTVTIAATGTNLADAVVRIISCQYITFIGIDVQNAGTTTDNYVEYGYHITNSSTDNGVVGSSHITIQNAAISTYRLATAATVGVYQNPAVTPTSIEGSNRDNRYLNLQITNSFNGVYCVGNATYHDANIEIGSTEMGLDFSNRFQVGGFADEDMGGANSTNCYGIYATNVEGLRIHDCDIRNITATNSGSSVNGIYASNLYTTENYINNNRINNIRNNSTTTTTATVYGIFVSPPSGANEVRVYNNFVSNLNQSRTTEQTNMRINGILCTAGTSGGAMCYIAYNSVMLNPITIGGSNTCLYILSGPATVNNNVLVNRTANQTTARHFGIYAPGSTAITCDYNDIFVQNSGNGYTGYRGANYLTLAEWQIGSGGLDMSSISADPMFASEAAGDLHIADNVASPLENIATPLGWAAIDIDGDVRSLVAPDLGADEESVLLPPDAPVVSNVGYENGSITISWEAVTSAIGYNVYRSINPYFVPSESTLLTSLGSVTTYSETVVELEQYYRITAVNGTPVTSRAP